MINQLLEWANYELYVNGDFAKVKRIISVCEKIQSRKQIWIDRMFERLRIKK